MKRIHWTPVGAITTLIICVMLAGAVVMGTAEGIAQTTGSVTAVQVTGLATLTLASAVDSTGVQTGVTTDYAGTVRCIATFSAIDAANDADLEATVNGTTWHLIDTADPDAAATFLLDDTTGPWQSMRANVVALGAGVDVTITCLATMRR